MKPFAWIRLLIIAGATIGIGFLAMPVFGQDADKVKGLQRVIEAQQKQLELQQKQLEAQQKQLEEQMQLMRELQT